MKFNEQKAMVKKLKAWNKLSESYNQTSLAKETLFKITGNFSEIRLANPLVINRGDQEQLFIVDSGLTDYQVRCALIPLLEARLQKLQEQMDKL